VRSTPTLPRERHYRRFVCFPPFLSDKRSRHLLPFKASIPKRKKKNGRTDAATGHSPQACSTEVQKIADGDRVQILVFSRVSRAKAGESSWHQKKIRRDRNVVGCHGLDGRAVAAPGFRNNSQGFSDYSRSRRGPSLPKSHRHSPGRSPPHPHSRAAVRGLGVVVGAKENQTGLS
jgi:hypothetical protein